MNNFSSIRRLTVIILILLSPLLLTAQESASSSLLNDTTFQGLKFRNIGPAFMSGRIADIAIHPHNNNIWYVAVGSGGVWKTTNAGTTWSPIFDKQTSYSTGCITINANNPHIIWVGTGENVGGRHVGYGDGIYKSEDGGKTWKNMGLKESQHISKIIIHPSNSNIIWVAAQGPLWNKGGDRGLYKTTDGGKTWKKVLGDNEWVGATDIVIDPRTPDRLYAATWQRHRNVAAYLGGGPGTAIYRTEDGGENWQKLEKGLPSSNMGKIGLAISPQQPDVVYAAIELDRRKGGVFRSEDRGASWEKRSDAVSSATGPHYYQELYPSPHRFDQLYLMDYRMQISNDGGKTFHIMQEKNKHSDNHAIAFRSEDSNYLLVGTDGGLYESFDGAKNWRFIDNLPITQFYKLAVDDTKPFYNIYGGTQDNNTQGGPSRTDNVHGIRNADWYITLFADGHQPATEPGNPAILYCEWQEGNLVRIDRATGEIIHIQPQPRKDEPYERYNWDAPILVSPHSPTRLYFASQRVWRSEDRGDSWEPISKDLTRNENRISLPIMGNTQSWDNAWDFDAMSNYNTITSLAESPVQENLIYAGTDDGILQVTEDGGKNWRKIEIGSLPHVPPTAFVNDIKADLFEANTVYVALDNHKFGDFSPYLLKSSDRGRTWIPIAGNLPNRTLVWRIIQDHINPKLLFAGTEFGIYFSINGGKKWVKFKGNIPTIPFRDLTIQRRENDLIGASFGRGFFVLDDYSVLRLVSEKQLEKEATLFAPRKAWWYIPRPILGMTGKGYQGASHYIAPNPPFGAIFTYYLAQEYMTKKEKRQKLEKKLLKEKKALSVPSWNEIEIEHHQDKPKIWLTVTDQEGKVIRRIEGPTKKGFHRVAWDLHYPAPNAIRLTPSDPNEYAMETPKGRMAAPGTYFVTLSKQIDGIVSNLSDPIEFRVEKMHRGTLAGNSMEKTVDFWQEIDKAHGQLSALNLSIQNMLMKIKALKKAISNTTSKPGELDLQLHSLREMLLKLDTKINGPIAKKEIGEKSVPTLKERLMLVLIGTQQSTYGPTTTHLQNLTIVKEELKIAQQQIKVIRTKTIPDFEKAMLKAGSPWVSGMPIAE
ncbi:MAG: glycosyl hydrolase [Marinifilaceae bacterium]